MVGADDEVMDRLLFDIVLGYVTIRVMHKTAFTRWGLNVFLYFFKRHHAGSARPYPWMGSSLD